MSGLLWWLRQPAGPAAAVSLVTALVGLALLRFGRGGFPGFVAVAVLVVTLATGVVQQRQIVEASGDWTGYSNRVSESGVASFSEALRAEVAALDQLAERAADAPSDPARAFAYLQGMSRLAPHQGVVLYSQDGPVAWAGALRAPTQWRTDSGSLDWSQFYVTLRRTAERGPRRAVAEAVLHAVPPANRVAASLEAATSVAPELAGFEFRPAGEAAGATEGWRDVVINGQPLLAVRPRLHSQGETVLQLTERARLTGGLGLALAVMCLVALAWRRPAAAAQRLIVLACLLALVAVFPFSAYSNISQVFDPGVYYSPTLGALSGSIAALVAASGLLLLGLFALERTRVHLGPRWLAFAPVVLVASLGPFLLRDLARGISLPGRGATVSLWLSWQVALFLAAATILLAAATAGRILLGRGRGGSPWIAPALAAIASIVAPLLWEAPGRWPDWYIGFWIVAVGSLALARRSRALMVSAGIVAACGATTLTWYAVARARVALAEADVRRLSTPDPAARDLLQRLADAIAYGVVPRDRVDLLRRFVESPLAEAGQPVELAHWLPDEARPVAEIRIADFTSGVEGEGGLVRAARATGTITWDTRESAQGTQMVVAVPHDDRSVTSIVVAPRSLLIEPDPFTLMVGLSSPAETEPPYDLALTTLPSPVPVSARPSWSRKANELHGDWLVPGAGEGSRVHVEIDLRSLDVLVPRGALMVILDLIVFVVIWTLAAAADGGLWRWARSRARAWGRSYRGRLTVTFFAFFVIPAVAFASWSYRRLIEADNESRALLLRENLRAVVSAGGLDDLASIAGRFGTPLLAYRGGALYQSSDPLYAQLAPVGQYLPPDVAIGLGVEAELTVSARPLLAGTPVLFGYRSVGMVGASRAVLAAPGNVTERVLDQQRRDIGILVLFVTSLGALAALALSGIAARELGRPIGALRKAALNVAQGERVTLPAGAPAREFVPVFSAFERMGTDLAASRAALEEAHRRTESVLRDVASGVIATDRDGRVMLANPGADMILGHPVTPGATLREIGDPMLAARTEAFLAGGADEEAFDVTLGARQVRGSLARLTRGGGGAVLTLEDITELARAQRVLAWGEMARQVAHEIKNPLTPIRLGVQHMRRARGDRRVDFERIFEQNVVRILAEIDRLDEIARSFSRFGRAPSERPEPVVLDVAAIARDVLELERLGEGAIEWHIEGADAPARALALDDELREVLLNVLENARQAGARRVAVAVRHEGDRVELVVTDDGGGVAAADLGRIFEPRFSTRTSGSGLGLAISRQMVEAWGGRMTAEAAVGAGTVIRISLAAAPAA